MELNRQLASLKGSSVNYGIYCIASNAYLVLEILAFTILSRYKIVKRLFFSYWELANYQIDLLSYNLESGQSYCLREGNEDLPISFRKDTVVYVFSPR